VSQNVVPDIQKLLQIIEEAISQEIKDSDRIMSDLQECRQLGVEVLPLDMNMSYASCSIEDDWQIRIGFSLLASRREQFIEDILAERRQNGHFRSFQDFCERIDLKSVPEDFITRCIQVGAFDSIEASRSRLFLGREKIIHAVRKANAEKSTGQFSLFAALPTSSKNQDIPLELPEAETWTDKELITHEKDAVGFSFTEYLFRSEEANAAEADVFEPDHDTIPNDQQETAESVREEAEAVPPTFIIQLSTTTTTAQTLLRLREIMQKYPGSSRVMLEFIDERNSKTHIQAHADYSVQISEDLVKEVEMVNGVEITRVQ
jgi:DNA polymerase III alpha subunit